MAQIKTNLQYGVTGSLQTASYSSLDATKLSGNLPALNASSLTNLDASDLTGALPAISGASLTNLSAGKVLQVVQAVSSTEVYVTTINTWADLISAQITPAHTSNKILALFSTWNVHKELASTSTIDRCQLLRDTTAVKYVSTRRYGHVGTAENAVGSADITYMDSPSTTSQIDYSIQTYREGSSGTYGTQWGYDSSTNCISLILMEIDGT